MARKSASDLVEDLAGLGEEILKRAIAETRSDVAAQVEDQFLGTKNRKMYSGAAADDCIVSALADFPTMTDARLQALRERFETDGVSDDFRAGILFAVRLVADKDYDY